MISYITLIDILISKMPFCDFFDWHWKKNYLFSTKSMKSDIPEDNSLVLIKLSRI